MTRFRRDPADSRGWWLRHTAKWIAFYPPLIFILASHVNPYRWLFVAAACWIAWRLAARWPGGVKWGSWWTK
ncbi:MAG: hypothetical protein OXQ29_06645 [Rhodospirillaceae bacterium]|nr:hypothetical protein [Rhodospirillaceae bacterium]